MIFERKKSSCHSSESWNLLSFKTFNNGSQIKFGMTKKRW